MSAEAPPAIRRRVEQVARLIRSKGVALIFATQSPADLPAAVSGQLQTRIQHGLRAATPAQHRAIRAAAGSMPAAPGHDIEAILGELGVGQAVVSVPGAGGRPTLADVTRIATGAADLSPLADAELRLDPPPAPVARVAAPADAPAPVEPGLVAALTIGRRHVLDPDAPRLAYGAPVLRRRADAGDGMAWRDRRPLARILERVRPQLGDAATDALRADLELVHTSIIELDLDALADAAAWDLSHDVLGIAYSLDRTRVELIGFAPRYVRRSRAA